MRRTIGEAALLLALFSAAAALSGCRIDRDQHGDGKDLKIATPFGGMSVKTNDTDVIASIGLPVYPGATPVKKTKEYGRDEDGAADINMSFGSFQLKVKAASYRTADSPERVMAFYKKALGRYGNIIQCEGKHPVGTPTRTAEGLTCNDDDHGDGNIRIGDLQITGTGHDEHTQYQLKAGSKKHQHVVDLNPESPGTRFGLVALDLPTDFHFGTGDKKKDKEDEQ